MKSLTDQFDFAGRGSEKSRTGRVEVPFQFISGVGAKLLPQSDDT